MLHRVVMVGFGADRHVDDAVQVVMLAEVHHCGSILIRSPASIPVVDHSIAFGSMVGLDPWF
jgi:hypothetical protein